MKIKEIINELINFSHENEYSIDVVNEEDESTDIKKITLDLVNNKLIFD
jgi:hypothetical protein